MLKDYEQWIEFLDEFEPESDASTIETIADKPEFEDDDDAQ